MPERSSIRRVALAVLVLVLAGATGSRPGSADALRFVIQPEASEVTFKATSRLMNADGRFSRLRGHVVVDPENSATAKIVISIEAASIDTGIGIRDRHLRSVDFFDVGRFPTISFESVGVDAAGRRATVTGKLTMHGVTRDIAVPVDVQITSTALVATGEFVVNRGDYGMNYNSYLNPIGNEVRVAFTFRARAS